MKTCTICKQSKDLIEFNKNKVRKDGLNNICKVCSRRRSKVYYFENQSHHTLNVRTRNRKQTEKNQNFVIRFLRRQKCIDCGTNDYVVLEFDHICDKKKDISVLISSAYSLNTLKTEIRKCEIVCANCHRRRTHKRANTYRTREY